MTYASRIAIASANSRRRGTGCAGLTILELMMVMAIASMLMGISIASFSRVGRGPAIDIAEREVRHAMARARMSARQQSALCRVVFVNEPAPGIRLTIARDAGSWHFNDIAGSRVLGGRNQTAVVSGAKIVPGGTVRSCVEFAGGGEVVCDPAPGYDPSLGFDLSLDVRPDDDLSGGPLASMGDVFTLELGSDGGIEARLDVAGLPGDRSTLKTPPALLAPGVWARVGLTFDGYEMLIAVHGVIEARRSLVDAQLPGPVRLQAADARDRLRFGGKGFRGALDEILYRTAEEEDFAPLAQGRGVVFDHGEPRFLRFDSEGRLDSRVHGEPVEVAVKDEEARRVVSVDLSGVIR